MWWTMTGQHDGKRILVAGFSNNRAGTESVIRNYVYKAQDKIAFDFLVWEAPTNFPEIFDKTHNRYFVIPRKSRNPLGYRQALRRFFDEHGSEYVAVWSSMCNYSNIDYLRYAKRFGIDRRIVHAHSDSYLGAGYNVLLSKLNRQEALDLANERWACGRLAGDFFFGDLDYEIVANAVDPSRYEFSDAKRSAFRQEFNIPSDSFVVGAVGTLNEGKNHSFLLDVFERLAEMHPNSRLVIVGAGELHDALVAKADDLGLSDCVVFAGERADMSEALSGLDVFAFPSLHEGLPMAVVEAQFNGLPCLVSDQVSEESSIAPGCTFAPLGDAGLWADQILKKADKRFDVATTDMGRFDINVSADRFIELMVGGRRG